MKKIIRLVTLSLATLLAFSCAKTQSPQQPSDKALTFNITNNAIDTKASINADATSYKWDSGDAVGSFFYIEGLKNLESPVSISESGAQITINPGKEIEEDLIYAYYPFNADNNNVSAKEVNIFIPTNQDGVTIKDAMPMVGCVEVEALPATSLQTINFNNLAGVLEFNIYATEAEQQNEKVVSVTFGSENVVGAYVVNITASQPTLGRPQPGFDEVTATLAEHKTVGTSKAAASTLVYVVVAPGAYTDADITVETETASYTATLTDGVLVDANDLVPININLSNAKFKKPEAPIADGDYVIYVERGSTKYMMQADASGYRQAYAELTGTPYVGGKYNVTSDCAWTFTYDSDNNRYTIANVYENKYLKDYSSGTNLKLVATDAGTFEVIDNGDDTYTIKGDANPERRIAYNQGG
ncbi:MAG: hypothetical protein HUJ95_03910, partial [Bacteroidales bacterium]|nr:hypothetical protein [Bacteroidales bacterium]